MELYFLIISKNVEAESEQKSEQSPPPSVEERWDEISPQLSIVMREGTIPEVIPFDATLDVPIDEQKYEFRGFNIGKLKK